MKLFNELSKRNVIRMAGLYLISSWLIIQLSEAVLPVFGVPAWVSTALTIALAVGFIPALILSWIYELTPEGVKLESEVTPEESMASITGRRMDRLLLLMIPIVIVVLLSERIAPGQTFDEATEAPLSGEASIAVLPFVNMSPDADNEYFADGISEELLNVLATIEGLRVASRTSAFSFKGTELPLSDIADMLEVGHVLSGSVRKQDLRVRISAQLVHADTDVQLWSQTYERDLVDIFGVQEEIAQSITAELKSMLGDRQVRVRASTADLQAYERFLSGRARFHRRDELAEAITDLNFAVAQDPDFADAWIYLAATHSVSPYYIRSLRPIDTNASTRIALAQAQRLAPDHPLALAVEGQMLTESRDLIGAMDRLTRAAELTRLDPTPVMWLGYFLLRAGYIDQAIEVLEEAMRKDPLVGINHGQLAVAYLSAGQRARAETEAALALDRGWAPAQYLMAMDLLGSGMRDRGIEALTKFLEPRWPEGLASDQWAPFNAALTNPELVDDYWPTTPKPYALEESIGLQRQDLLLDYLAQVDYTDMNNQDFWFWLRSAWLPSTKAFREDPRFFAAVADLGLVDLWEEQGYPAGCRPSEGPEGRHLDCAEFPQ
jgi:TolB-like protein/cytochrome c-type biogenesis protein CcmH/NrfG